MEEIEFETDSEFNTYGIGMTESSSDAETESLGRSVLEVRTLNFPLSPRPHTGKRHTKHSSYSFPRVEWCSGAVPAKAVKIGRVIRNKKNMTLNSETYTKKLVAVLQFV
jgi:hypothetical protein